MKNFKKSLALLVACVMVFGMVAFAAFPDVPLDANYKNAVEILSQLKVMIGDEKGNFNPDQTIIRSEAAKIMCWLLGTGELAPSGTQFKDVAADHWASGYINYANANSIMIGFDANTFGPDETLTYEQFVKMLVIALGYNPMAIDKAKDKSNPYPEGYISAAAAIGLTNNAPGTIGLQVKRSTIALLASNALDINLMVSTVVTGIGGVTYTTTEILDGKKDRDYATMATRYLNAYKVKGTVTETSLTSTSSLKLDHVNFTVTADYGSLEFIAIGTSPSESNPRQANIFDRTGKASAFLNTQSIAYLQKTDDGIYEIVSIYEDKSKNSTLEISKITNVEASETTFGTAGATVVKLGYYTNRDTETKAKRVDVQATAAVYYNGTKLERNGTAFTAGAKTWANMTAVFGEVGSVQLLDSDNNGIYDYIYVTAYKNYVVDEGSNADKMRIVTEGLTIILDPEVREELEGYTLTKDGVAIGIADLQKGDVLNVATPDGIAVKDAKYIDIIVTRNTVTGSVSEINTTKKTFYVDGTKYEVSGIDLPQPGDAGEFYLNLEGKVVGYDTSIVVGDNYAYGLSYKVGDDFYNAKLKVLNKEGNILNYDLKADVRFNDEKLTVKTTKIKVSLSGAAAVEMSANEFFTGFLTAGSAFATASSVAVYNIGTDTIYETYTAAQFKYAKLFVLGLDADGAQITSIDLPKFNNADANRDFDVVKYDAGSSKYEGGRIGNSKVGANTKIFYIPTGKTESDYELVKVDALGNEDSFEDYALYDANRTTKELGAILTFGYTSASSDKSPLAIVTDITTARVDGEDVTYIRAFENGEAKTLTAKGEQVTSKDTTVTGGSAKTMNIGDVFSYKLDTKGFVSNVYVQARLSQAKYDLYKEYMPIYNAPRPSGDPIPDPTAVNVNAYMSDDIKGSVTNIADSDNEYFYGYSISQSGLKEITISTNGYNQAYIDFDANTAVYVYDRKKTNNIDHTVKLGDVETIDFTDFTKVGSSDKINFGQEVEPCYVFIRAYNGVAKEIVVVRVQ